MALQLSQVSPLSVDLTALPIQATQAGAFTAIVNPKDLARFVKVAHPLIPKTHVPILQGYHLECTPGGITLTVCDGETWLKASFPGMTEGTGAVIVNGKSFKDALASVAKASDVLIQFTNPGVHVGAFKLQAMDATDYPDMPAADKEVTTCNIPSDELKFVSRFMSADPHRAVLNGVKIEFLDGKTNIIATDTHRLGVRTVERTNYKSCIAVLSSAVVGVCQRAGGEIELRVPDDSGMWTRIEVGGYLMSTNTLRGQYPNWERVVPAISNATKVYNIEAKAFKAALESVKGLAKDNANRVRLTFDGSTMTVRARSEERGECEATCGYAGHPGAGYAGYGATLEPWECALNVTYAIEAIDALACDGIRIYATENTRPVLFTDYDRDDTQVVVMPMQLS